MFSLTKQARFLVVINLVVLAAIGVVFRTAATAQQQKDQAPAAPAATVQKSSSIPYKPKGRIVIMLEGTFKSKVPRVSKAYLQDNLGAVVGPWRVGPQYGHDGKRLVVHLYCDDPRDPMKLGRASDQLVVVADDGTTIAPIDVMPVTIDPCDA
jgi:hypothetical protein